MGLARGLGANLSPSLQSAVMQFIMNKSGLQLSRTTKTASLVSPLAVSLSGGKQLTPLTDLFTSSTHTHTLSNMLNE